LTVRLLGPGGVKYGARTVDVSRGGMLAEITDPDFLPLGERADLLPFAARVATVFPQGMDVFFGDGAVQVHADVVRLVTRPGDQVLLLGCRFHPELSDFDCRLLGVETAGDETDLVAAGGDAGDPPIAAASDDSPEDRPPETDAAEIELPPTPRPASSQAPAAAPAPATPSPAPVSGFQLADERRTARREPLLPAAPPSSSSPQRETPRSPRPSAARPAEAPLTLPPAAPPPPRPPLREVAFAPAPSLGADSRALSLRLAGPGVVLAHLFPVCGTIFGFGSRFAARVVELDDRRVVLEVAVPEEERDPLAYAAGLGADTRAVVVKDGAVLWETRIVVERLLDGSMPATVRVEGRAVRPPTPRMRSAFSPAAA
jgi:hypothetical protein